MSKVDAQRAMKAARHSRPPAPPAARPAAAPGSTPAGSAPQAPASPTTAPRAAQPAVPDGASAAPAGTTALCGHRNMAGKECRRSAGHPEKSHRYS